MAPSTRTNPTAVAVKHFHPPQGFDLAVIAGVAIYFVAFVCSRLGLLDPGTIAWEALERGRFFPGGPRAFRALVDALLVPVLALHLAEMWWLDRSRLARHGVARWGGAWWLWVVSCFFEGVMAFRRFDRVVEGLERRGGGKESKI